MAPQVAFAKREIESRFPWFQFTVADVHNSVYNPAGKTPAEEYEFPYRDQQFDVIYAASLFTHLLPRATRRYFAETSRVLRPGGRCLYSFFLLDHYDGKGKSAAELYEFEHPVDGEDAVAVHNSDVPEQVVAYSGVAVSDIANRAGLQVERILPGFWSTTAQWSLNEQDLVVLRRPIQGS